MTVQKLTGEKPFRFINYIPKKRRDPILSGRKNNGTRSKLCSIQLEPKRERLPGLNSGPETNNSTTASPMSPSCEHTIKAHAESWISNLKTFLVPNCIVARRIKNGHVPEAGGQHLVPFVLNVFKILPVSDNLMLSSRLASCVQKTFKFFLRKDALRKMFIFFKCGIKKKRNDIKFGISTKIQTTCRLCSWKHNLNFGLRNCWILSEHV